MTAKHDVGVTVEVVFPPPMVLKGLQIYVLMVIVIFFGSFRRLWCSMCQESWSQVWKNVLESKEEVHAGHYLQYGLKTSQLYLQSKNYVEYIYLYNSQQVYTTSNIFYLIRMHKISHLYLKTCSLYISNATLMLLTCV